MSTAEITAYLYGAECAAANVPIHRVFLRPAWRFAAGQEEELRQAALKLGGDKFAYWVRRGMDEAPQCQG